MTQVCRERPGLDLGAHLTLTSEWDGYRWGPISTRALASGIDVTHLDTHMGAVGHPRFVAGDVRVALQHRLPAMIPRLDEAGWRALGMDGEMAALQNQ